MIALVAGDVVAADRASHPCGVRRVRHDVERPLAHPPDDDVVEHRAVVVEEVRVLRSPHGDLPEVVRERRLQPVERVVAFDPDGAEMADVERDGIGAAGHVLGDRAGLVRERHLPPAEVDQLGAEGAVFGVERRVAQLGHDPGRAGVSSMPNRSTRAA